MKNDSNQEWEAQGAVAWQCKEVGGTFWQDCSKERALVRAANPSKWEVRELYTHALPAQPAEPVNAELVKALKKLLEQYDELAEEDNSGWILAGELAKANHAREVLSRVQSAPAVGAPDACVWTPDTDYETDVHYSACGEAWSFIEGGPKENKVRFCQGCGKPVVIASAQHAMSNPNNCEMEVSK